VQIPPANGKQGLTALTNKKQEVFDQIRANMQSYKKFNSKEKHLKPAATLF
jgi:hypothetical protein